MSKADDCCLNAAETLDLAHKASTNGDKLRLLRLAEKWLDLADRICRARRQSTRPFGEHPLVLRRLGGEQQEAD